MPFRHPALERAAAFCEAYALRVPILLAPMAGACPPALSAAVATAGGMGACGALLMQPAAIKAWASELRSRTNGGFQINLWIPDPPPKRDKAAEAEVRTFLAKWGPEVAPEAGDARPVDFASQCDAILDVGPAVVSSIMGIYPPDVVARMRAKGIRWFATVTTVAEALEAEAAGATASLQVAPYYNKPTSEGLYQHFKTIADNTSLPIMLYSIPGRCGIEIGLDVLERLRLVEALEPRTLDVGCHESSYRRWVDAGWMAAQRAESRISI